MPKEAQSPNEITALRLLIIRHSFELRHSDFVIPTSWCRFVSVRG